MTFKKSFKKDRKAVSSIFIAIYIALFVVILISTLFVGISISNVSLANYIQTEQEKSQEQIIIGGSSQNLRANLSTSTFDSLLVNNTGSLTARIKAIYIDGKIICDPSTFPGDSYIAPQSSLWIDLTNMDKPPKINEASINGNWTVTTERGTKDTELGANLWLGPPIDPNDPNKLYFGPLLLIFNIFHWSSDGGKTWNAGWTIPQSTSANQVIWRILVADIDKRSIKLDSDSNFALIANNNLQNQICSWDIDTSRTTTTLIPEKYTFIYFSNVNGNLPPSPRITSNFMTILGSFIENDGTLTAFGQTIPFEAVLVT